MVLRLECVTHQSILPSYNPVYLFFAARVDWNFCFPFSQHNGAVVAGNSYSGGGGGGGVH